MVQIRVGGNYKGNWYDLKSIKTSARTDRGKPMADV